MKPTNIVPLPQKPLPETLDGVINSIIQLLAPLPKHKADRMITLLEQIEWIYARDCDRAAGFWE